MGRFKIDENLPEAAVALLAAAGHDASSVVRQGMGGHADADIAEVCRVEQRVLVTCDLDFANTLAYPPANFAGILVLRIPQDRPTILATLRFVLTRLAELPLLSGKLWIVDQTRIRIRA